MILAWIKMLERADLLMHWMWEKGLASLASTVLQAVTILVAMESQVEKTELTFIVFFISELFSSSSVTT